jgi:hypothetical protein
VIIAMGLMVVFVEQLPALKNKIQQFPAFAETL